MKPVFIELQGDGKCCFCERQFESGILGRHELDLEHFRPKGNIKEWPCPQSLIVDGVTLTTPPAAGTGYYLLSYHLLNYAVACKACNSGLKKDYFNLLVMELEESTNRESREALAMPKPAGLLFGDPVADVCNAPD